MLGNQNRYRAPPLAAKKGPLRGPNSGLSKPRQHCAAGLKKDNSNR